MGINAAFEFLFSENISRFPGKKYKNITNLFDL